VTRHRGSVYDPSTVILSTYLATDSARFTDAPSPCLVRLSGTLSPDCLRPSYGSADSSGRLLKTCTASGDSTRHDAL